MKKNTQSGFSLIELLCVVTIIGIIAAIGVPSLQKGIRAADNGAAFAQLRVISSAQLNYYSQHNRFARLNELNTVQNGGFGITSGNTLAKSRFVYEMSPMTPSDTDLKDGYTITASGLSHGGVPYVFRVTQTGYIEPVLP